MKPSPPKKPAPSRLVNAMLTLVPLAAQRKASFWHKSVPPCCRISIGIIWVWGGERDSFLAGTAVSEMRHENRFTRQHSFAGTKQFAHDSLAGSRAIAHFGFESNPIVHIIHRSSLGYDCFSRIQLNLDNLHIIPKNLIIDFMALHNRSFLFLHCLIPCAKFVP
jgi:hypothetical protein